MRLATGREKTFADEYIVELERPGRTIRRGALVGGMAFGVTQAYVWGGASV
jgi:hypothetical protein